MKIIAISDVHGKYGKIDAILHEEKNYDFLIIAGDLTTKGSPRDVKRVVEQYLKPDKPLLIVAGNMDLPVLDDLYDNMGLSLNAKGVLHGDVGFFGISGAPTTLLRTPNEVEEPEILRRAEAGWAMIKNAKTKIFVPHAPPHNTKLDKVMSGFHAGSKSVRQFIDEKQPDLVICGHIHEAKGIDTIGKTTIVNCGSAGQGHYALIDIKETISASLRSV